jgi:hypothetical protein
MAPSLRSRTAAAPTHAGAAAAGVRPAIAKVTDAQYMQVLGVRERYNARMAEALGRARKAVFSAMVLESDFQKELAALQIDAPSIAELPLATYSPPAEHLTSNMAHTYEQNPTTLHVMAYTLLYAENRCESAARITHLVPRGGAQWTALANRKYNRPQHSTPEGSWAVDASVVEAVSAAHWRLRSAAGDA